MSTVVPRKGRWLDLPGTFGMFDRWFDDLGLPKWVDERPVIPAFDVSETDESIIVKADIPGVDVKDLDISIVGNVLTVKGEKKQEKEEKGESYHRVERVYGSFSRSINLPGDVNTEKVEAFYKDGVLKLTIPKSGKAKRKKIEVKS